MQDGPPCRARPQRFRNNASANQLSMCQFQGVCIMLPPRIDQAAVKRRIGAYADTRQTLEQRGAAHQELLGFVPPRIEARLTVTGALDPTMVDLQEQIRAHGMYPKCFDVKT